MRREDQEQKGQESDNEPRSEHERSAMNDRSIGMALPDHLLRRPLREPFEDRRKKSRGIAAGRPGSNIRCSRFDGFARATSRDNRLDLHRVSLSRAIHGPRSSQVKTTED